MGNFNPIHIVSNTCLTNMIYLSLLILQCILDWDENNATLLLAFDFQEIKAPQKYKFHPKTLMPIHPVD
jgi:hypothetical protein